MLPATGNKSIVKKKMMIFDFDAHHGNGIQAAFEEDPDVLYISIHEHPTFSFPGTGYAEDTGTNAGIGTTLNIPLPPGADDAMVSKVLTNKIIPAVNNFKPDAIIVSAGFDAHVQDDMSGLAYSTELYGQFGKFVSSWAKQYCQGKILTILEGGYHLPSLAASVESYLTGLAENYQEE